MLQNRFLLPRLLGKNLDGLHISPDSDELEMMHIEQLAIGVASDGSHAVKKDTGHGRRVAPKIDHLDGTTR